MTFSTKNLKIFTITSAVITSILGVLFHFAYDFFNYNIITALFTPVNESTWEHLKLIFFPMLLCMIAGLFLLHYLNTCYTCYVIGFTKGIFAGIAVIVILFYSFTGLIGHNVDWINIAIYFIGVIIAYVIFYRQQIHCSVPAHLRHTDSADCPHLPVPVWLSYAAIAVCTLLFFIFTFNPPHIPLFIDPINGTYGI